MDEIVKAALIKWPKVPHCHGWLALDARGQWFMRDERIQAAGPFPQIKGSRVDHPKLREFIARNYSHDEHGAWFFQNGPQRVYVELEAAPWVWRIHRSEGGEGGQGGVELQSHTGQAARLRPDGGVYLDDSGRLFLHTDIGLGIVHSLDMEAAADEVASGRWQPVEMRWADMPQRFGYRLKPEPA